jgi:capsular exopolysaccharide synthesis family protein
LASLRQTEAVIDGDAEVIRRARRPATPSEPQPERSALIGGFIGLLLGLALAFAKEQMDRRVRTSDDLEDAFDLPVLASIPRSRALGGGRRGAERLPHVEAEAFQMLRANLRHLKQAEEPRSLVVTSTTPAEGKTTVALQLARADAMIGRRVLLIEADLRRPALGKVLGIDDRRGLGAYLVEQEAEVADVIRQVPLSISANGEDPRASMDVIVAGEPPAHPAGAVNSSRMSELIAWAQETYDLVVIDTSPAGSVADAVPLMAQVDAVVVVGRLGKLNARQATRLRGQLERVGAPTSGLVATFVPRGDDAYGYGY